MKAISIMAYPHFVWYRRKGEEKVKIGERIIIELDW